MRQRLSWGRLSCQYRAHADSVVESIVRHILRWRPTDVSKEKRMTADGTLTFWGVRGSIPAPGLHTVTFGGNTSCVSVEYGEHVVIFDAGSGLRRLGLYLLARPASPPITGSLFLTHTHWDHIQGLPFFTPAFAPENQFVIYGEARRRYSLVELMEDQIQHPFFPVEMPDLFRAHVNFRELESGETVEIAAPRRAAPRHGRPPRASQCRLRLCAPARRAAGRLYHGPRTPSDAVLAAGAGGCDGGRSADSRCAVQPRRDPQRQAGLGA
jgi:Beta-lactamase superfamily domain